MAIVFTREIPKERSASGKKKDGDEYTRGFWVRTDSPTESLVDISNAPGIAYYDAHPDNSSCVMDSYDIKPADDSGLLYVVSFKYKKFSPDDQEDPDPEKPGSLPFKPSVWGGSSSVVVEPIYKDRFGNIMTNSAGDALEDLQAERAEERLTLTQYYASHTGWMALARAYTNTVNDENWNGGGPRTWKCQGCSKKLNIESRDGGTIVYWEVTWEFAYKADEWTLKPWDIGFAQLVDENGDPDSYGTKRAQIKGQDGKGVRQPVALQNGVAKPAGQPPDALDFWVYEMNDFMTPFGEVFTPGA
jgi:hypothetical protein